MLEPNHLIREDILSILPSIPGESVNRIVEKLVQQGIETQEDLYYVREEDTEEFLKAIQCQKFLDAWKHRGKKNRSSLFFIFIFNSFVIYNHQSVDESIL